MPFGIRVKRYFCGTGAGVECFWQIRLRWRWKGWYYERCWYPFRAKFTEHERLQYLAEAALVLRTFANAATIEDMQRLYSTLKYL